jgi:ribosome recycling factor
MNEEVQMYLDDAKEHMQEAVSHLDKELGKVRAGKANPAILDDIKVDYYGIETPLNRVSNVGASDAKTLVIQPWEKSMIDVIEKAIMKANIGLTPNNNGELIRINIPPLTEERRKELVKQIKNISEQTKVSIRSKRREANDEIKALQKEGLSEDEAKEAENEVQKLTDTFSEDVDKLLSEKEEEVMKV